jgi:fatty acid amide hydrolase 2
MNDLLTLSATRLAAMIRQREVASLDVVDAHIAHVRRVNPAVNAVVCDRFDEARREARLADERLRNGGDQPLGPLHGVPCSIKEAFALTGMPNTSGLVARKGRVATEDATAVARLRAAGAIPLGVTNVSELCMWMESDNNVYGRTRNPYGRWRIAGGSSGGEGAIVGAGGAPFGLGSDIGGSIRLPAFFNGVFGHKPTGGLVPGTGQFPNATGDALRYVTTGPIARRAEDLMPLLRILAGPDGVDEGCRPFDLGDPGEVSLRGLEVLHVAENGAVRVSDEMLAAQERCAEALASRGAKVRPTKIEALRRSLEIWSAMLSEAGGPSFAELMGEGTEIRAGRELAKWLVGRSPHTFPAIGLAILEKAPKLLRTQARELVEEGRRLREQLASEIGPRGVMLYPPYASTAPWHVEPLLPPFKWLYTGIVNVTELPSTQVPLGLSRGGLPLGVQVIGTHGNDHVCIGVAMQLERLFGGWVPPPLFFG